MELRADSNISVTVRVNSITTTIDKHSILLRVEGFAIDYSTNIFPVVIDESYETHEVEKCQEASKKYRASSNYYVTGTFILCTSPTKIYLYPSSVSLLDAKFKFSGGDFLEEHEECCFAYDTWLTPMRVSGKIVSVLYLKPDSAARMMFFELAVEDKIIGLVLFSRELQRYKKMIKIDNLIDVYGRTARGEDPSGPDRLKEKIIVDRVSECCQLDI